MYEKNVRRATGRQLGIDHGHTMYVTYTTCISITNAEYVRHADAGVCPVRGPIQRKQIFSIWG